MPNLILRYSFYSKKTDLNIYEIAKMLKGVNVDTIYAEGDIFGNHIRKTNSIQYKYEYKNVTSVDDICNVFILNWIDFVKTIQELHTSFEFKSILLFEFDLDGDSHPELAFDKNFISFLSSVGSELQLFFYT